MKINFVSLNSEQKQNIKNVNFSKNSILQSQMRIFEKLSNPIQFSNLNQDVFVKTNPNLKTNFKGKISPSQNPSVYQSIKTLLTALNDKNPYTHNHSIRVGLYSIIFAKEIGITDKQLEQIETTALMHDIGKLTIPNSIICKSGRLTPEEYEIIKMHPINSEMLLSGNKDFKHLLPGIRHHHERWDGKGYPDGLKEKETPFISRLIAITDTYDAMTSQRPYRKELDHSHAIQEIDKHSGAQFDPKLAKKFIELENIISCAKNNPREYMEEYSILHDVMKDL